MMDRQEFTTYFSPSNIPLVYCGKSHVLPVLTVENYPKWQGFYLVHTDGTVAEVGFGELRSFADARHLAPYSNHAPNVQLVPELAEARGWILDPSSYEMMVGRWETDALGNYDY